MPRTIGADRTRERTEREYAAERAPWPHNYLFMPDEFREILARTAANMIDAR
jgi:hypothetical protein